MDISADVLDLSAYPELVHTTSEPRYIIPSAVCEQILTNILLCRLSTSCYQYYQKPPTAGLLFHIRTPHIYYPSVSFLQTLPIPCFAIITDMLLASALSGTKGGVQLSTFTQTQPTSFPEGCSDYFCPRDLEDLGHLPPRTGECINIVGAHAACSG